MISYLRGYGRVARLTTLTTLQMDIIPMNKLLYSYPDEQDMTARDIQEMIYRRLEFSELETDAEPKRITPGEYFPYQELGRRYMFPYDRMLCIMEPGTGKTCYNIGIAEKIRMIHDWVDTTMDTRNNIKRCYVLTSSDLLVSEFNYQFICRCTDGRYMSEKIRSARKSTGRSLQVNKIVKEFYDVMSYFDFNNIIKDLKDEQIIEKFSDCMFFFDEVHTFRNSDTKSQRETSIAYANIHNLVHISERIKVVLNTATPMIDNVNEVIPLINLIVKMDEQLDEEEGVEGLSIEELSQLLKGKVVFVRARPFKLNVIENGIDIRVSTEQAEDQHRLTIEGPQLEDEVSIRVVPVLLSEFQSEMYYEDYGTRRYTENSYLNTSQKAFFASDDPILNRVRDGPGQASMTVNEGFRQVLDEIEEFSGKIDMLLDSFYNDPGLHFVYWSYLEGGLNILAAILLTDGMERFSGMSSPYEREVTAGSRTKTSYMSEYCVSTNEDGESQFTRFSARFDKRPRFAILSGTNKAVHSRMIKEVVVHPDNLDGEYIKVLIASPVAKLGINLSNVSHVHILGPMWNLGNMIQAEYRSIRSESHTDLYNRLMRRKREKILNGEPLTPEEESEMVNIHINRYCAIPRYLDEEYLNSIGLSYEDPTDELYSYMLNNMTNQDLLPYLNRDIPQLRGPDIIQYPLSIDIYMYRRSVTKEIGIREMIRTMKRIAIDCNNNKSRNVVVDGQPGSLVCDYQACDYDCLYDPAIEDPDGILKGSEQQSYSALYMHDIMDRCRKVIDEEIEKVGSISWSDMLSLIDDDRTLELIVRHQIPQRLIGEYDQKYFTDRQGMPMYTMVNRRGIWLSNYLSSRIIGDVVPNPKQYFEKISLGMVIEQIAGRLTEYTDEDIQDIIDNDPTMTLTKKVSILESGILNDDQRIMDPFRHYIFVIPKRILRTYREGNRIVNETRIVPDEFEYIHIYPSDTKSPYLISSLYRSIPEPPTRARIYDTERGRWRNMNERDYVIYKENLDEALKEKIEPFESQDVIAYTDLIDYRLRLINHKQHVASLPEDNQYLVDFEMPDGTIKRRYIGPQGPRGRLCHNWDIDLMAESLYDVDRIASMLTLISKIAENPNIDTRVFNVLNSYIDDDQSLEPLHALYDRVLNAGQEFSFDDLPVEDLPGFDDPYDVLFNLLGRQYYDREGRPHARMNTVEWDVPKMLFVNLILLAYPSSEDICRTWNLEEIFDRQGALYRM